MMNEAMTLRRQLIQEQPLQEEIRRDLLFTMLNLSAVENQVGDAVASEQTLSDAITICDKAASDFPDIAEYEFLRVAVKNRLANSLVARHQSGEAVKYLNEPIDGILAKQESAGRLERRYRNELERALTLRAGQLSELGRHDDALVDWDAAIAMVNAVAPNTSAGLVLCRATTLLGSKSADSSQADSYASQAIELLEEALREGLPWKESIRRDPELEFLRNHPKYAEAVGDD